MPRVGFEPTISAGERPKTYALDRAATGTGVCIVRSVNIIVTVTTTKGISRGVGADSGLLPPQNLNKKTRTEIF